jgi:peptide/nickel transport system substrate-binding protein
VTAPSTGDLALKQVLSVKEKRRIPSFAQWKHLPRFLNKTERWIAFGALSVGLLAAGALGVQFFATHNSNLPAVGGSYTEGVIGYPSLINPLYANASDVDSDLAKLVYSGLMRFDPQDGLVPDLAEKVDISSDGKTYTFTLRDGALFQNGDPVTSADVAFTFGAISNPEYRSSLFSAFSNVTVETPDEKTAIFTLKEPFAPFLSFLTVGILPSHVWEEVPASSAQLTQLNIKPIGSGPYQFKKLTKDSKGTLRSITLERNDSFYRGAGYIKEITFKFTSSAEELSVLLRNHNIQGSVTLPFTDISRFSGERSLNLTYATLPQYTAAFFNMKGNGAIGDANVRKALNIGTDRQAIINNILGGKANALISPFFSGTPGGTPPEKIAGADIAGAQAALDAAGYKTPEAGGTRMKGDKPLAITLTVADATELTRVADELKAQWERLGFSVTVNALDQQDIQDKVLKTRTFDVLLAGELYGTFRDPYPYWHSSQGAFPGLNITQFTNLQADNAITTIRTAADEEKRNGAYGTLAGIFSEQIPAVFLYQPTYVYAPASKIQGMNLPTVNLPADRFADVNEWFIKTKLSLK